MAAKLTYIIADHLNDIKGIVDRKHYNSYVNSIVSDIERSLEDLLEVTQGGIHVKNLEKAWIACEPIIHLVPKWQNRLVNSLLMDGIQVTYFLEDQNWFDRLRKSLEVRLTDDDASLLSWVKVETRVDPPVFLYLGENKTVGLRGKFPPKVDQKVDGSYRLGEELPSDWIEFLGEAETREEFEKLKTLKSNTKGGDP